MPMEFSTSLGLDLLYARWWGRIDADQFHDTFSAYLADAYYRPGRPELLDLSGVTDPDLDFNYMRGILRRVNEQVPGVKMSTRIVIWAPGGTVFGLGRMCQELAQIAQGVVIDVFRSEAEALAALGLPHATIADLLAAGGFLPHTPVALATDHDT